MMNRIRIIAVLAVSISLLGIFLLLAVLKIFSAPLRWAVKLLLHALVGFAALFLLNFFGASLGISLELTWFNAIVTGVLGVPGVLLLLIFQYLI